MSNKTRKRIWPVSVVAVIGMVAILAALAVTAFVPGVSQAQGAPPPVAGPSNLQATATSASEISLSWSPGLGQATYELQRMAGTGSFATIADDIAGNATSYTDTGLTAGTMYTYQVRGVSGDGGMTTGGVSGWSNTAMATTETIPPPSTDPDMITSDSTTASGSPELQLTIQSLPMDMSVGSSIVLYLEDQFVAPSSIPMNSVYLVSEPAKKETGNAGRVYVSSPVKVKTSSYFDADKKDIAVRVLIPDMCPDSSSGCEGQDGLMMGDKVTLVIESDSGIKNPSEADKELAVGYALLGTSTASIPKPRESENATDTLKSSRQDDSGLDALTILAKITLSDVDNSRGYEMTVTGSGFNNGTTAAVYVLAASEKPTCEMIITSGTEVGGALVGSDDKAVVTFEVTAPTFKPGNVNYICMVDGEGRMSDTDVEDFKLEPSIKVVPSEVSSGDTVNVFAQDFPAGTGGFVELKIAGQVISGVVGSSIRMDGSGEATFEVPGGLEGVLRIDAKWGSVNEDSKITITGGDLSVSKTDALPNETITITGNGFGSQTCIQKSSITLDNVPVLVDEESLTIICDRDGSDATTNDRERGVEVSNSGQFVATIILWPASGTSNPTLIPGVHELSIEDTSGFGSSVDITIPEPTVRVTPDVAGPRDYITIVGENWPVDNPENPSSVSIEVEVDDNPGASRARTYILFADAVGRVTQEHRVHRNVAIPSTVQIKMTHAEVAEIGHFSVPASTIEVSPSEAQPGDMISLTAGNMPVYSEVDYVEVGGTRSNDPGVNTDRDGNVTVDDVLIPGLDPGLYSVVINVKGTIAIGEVTVLAESAAAGAPAELPGAVENLGDSLVAIFHFDDVGKVWSFYDPRPEFSDLNTLTEMVNGEAYWILVSETVEDVVLNNKVRSLTCRGDDCWNLEVW